MKAASWLQLAIAAPVAFYWLHWYVRRWGDGGRWRWWQKPLIFITMLVMLTIPFRVASAPFGEPLTGIPEQEPIFAIGAVAVLLAMVAWCVSGHIRLAVHGLLAGRPIDSTRCPEPDSAAECEEAESPAWLDASGPPLGQDRVAHRVTTS